MHEWFVSSSGRKVINVVAGIAGAGCFAGYVTPHSFLLYKTKEFLQMYKDGKPVELPDDLLIKAQQVLQDTSLSPKEKRNVKFFTTVGTDVLNAGSTQLNQGALIGIPYSYKYRSLSEINPQTLNIMHQSDFSWSSKVGQQILTTLLMSNRAQQFSIAREIYYSNTHYVYFTGFAAATNFLTAYSTGRYLNTKFNLYIRPFRYRVILYSILGTMGITMFLLMKDMLNVHYDAYADKMAANLGKNYVLGGIEYYEYLIERNKSVREALGEKGEKLYTAGGNVKEWIRVTQTPLTSRFNFMKECLENLEEKAQEEKSGEYEGAPHLPKLPEKVTSLPNPLLEKDVPLRGL